MRNLFQDYKSMVMTNTSNDDGKRSNSAMNYLAIKTQRIGEMTRRAADPRMSLSIDPGTGFVGKVPGFNNIKNTDK